jgi:RING-variant domain
MDNSKVAPIAEPELSPTRTCRICMEGESLSLQLLSPCKCSGSIKYIHEECLKTWLVSHMEDIAESSCEVCKTPLLMEFKINHKCNVRNSCNNGINSCMFIPVLVAIVIILFVIVYLLTQRYLSSSSDSEERGYTIALIITCSLSGCVLSLLILTSLKEACIVPSLENWKILSQNFDNSDEEVVELKIEDFPGTQVMIVPEMTRIRGVKVRTPTLRPRMQVLNKRGNVTAFTPACLSPNLSLYRHTPEPSAARTDPLRLKSKSPQIHNHGYKSIPDDSLNYI